MTDLNKSLEARNVPGNSSSKLKYVHSNAHQLRASVVNILELLNLLDNVHLQSEDKILIIHLMKCGKELDTITHAINQNLESEMATNKKGKA